MRNRKITSTLQQTHQSKFGRIIVLTGARQTGKTTIVKQAFKNYPYINIEDPISAKEYKQMTAAQWQNIFPQAIIDEIQKEPQLIESIKAVYDQTAECKYIILGSSQILLLKKIRESLAGRCSILEMYPLTLPEARTNGWSDEIKNSYFQNLLLDRKQTLMPFLIDPEYANKQEVFNNYLTFGGYPALSDKALNDDERWSWLRNYVRTYLERDLRDLAELRQLEPFTTVQKLLAINTAQLTNYTQIASSAKVSANTVQRFLEYLNISYQTLTLQAWSRNTAKRLVKSPKVHYLDVGIMRTLLQKKEALNGHEFESAIVAEIYKQTKAVTQDVSFYHLRTSDGREVDLLMETEKGYIAIEVKQTDVVRSVDGKHLRGLEDILDKPILHRIVLSKDNSIKDLGHGVIGMPAAQFLS